MDNRFLALIENSFKNHKDLPAFSDLNGSTYSFAEVAIQIGKLHILLEHAGIQKGDKVGLVGRNSSHWAISFFGVLAYGAVAVPILHDFTPENIHNIVNHSEAKALLVAGSNWEHLDQAQMPGVKLFMLLDDFSIIASATSEVKEVKENIDSYFQNKFPDSFSLENIKYHIEEPDELAVLNYTSGTTSNSKGVMIPYRSLWSNTQFAYDKLPFISPGDNIVCMLPIAHMYGLAFDILNSVNKGCHVHFLARTPSPKIIGEAFATIRPTLILAVPLVIEKIIRSRVFPELQKPVINFLWKAPLFNKIIKKKIADKLYQAFGGNLGELVIGGAAINKEVETFLRQINFKYTVGYGMTECGPLIAYEQWDTFKQGSVGRIVDRMEMKIDSPNEKGVGEILVKGTNLMLGYYKNEDATAAVMQADGWMRTGDLGIIDNDGFLYIRGRSKTMILSSNGQNIYPEEIEDKLNNMDFVAESLIVSSQGKLLALIYPDWEAIDKNHIDRASINSLIQENINKLNKQIPAYSKISGFDIQQHEFEKTPKRSIKRYLYQAPEA